MMCLGSTHQHLSDFLSELIENVVTDLASSKCIQVEGEDESDLSELNNGTIASFYYISFSTIEIFSNSVTEKSKVWLKI